MEMTPDLTDQAGFIYPASHELCRPKDKNELAQVRNFFLHYEWSVGLTETLRNRRESLKVVVFTVSKTIPMLQFLRNPHSWPDGLTLKIRLIHIKISIQHRSDNIS